MDLLDPKFWVNSRHDQLSQKREKENKEEWMVIITTDHGRGTSGHGHGGQTNRERNTWIATNYAGMNDYSKNQGKSI